jgi:hypothetical protein
MNLGTQSDAAKDPDRLEREIDEQRREINETLRALEEKFSSRELASQFAQYFTGPGREWVGTLSSSVKSNPVPTLLTAVGLAWLMMSDRHRSPYRVQRYADSYPGSRESRMRGMMDGVAESAHSAHDAAQSAYERAGERIGEAGERIGEKASEFRERMGEAGATLHDKAAHAREAWHEHAYDARDSLHHSAESLRDNFSHLAREQPLALGAIGIALGALIGAALPRTEQESRLLGRASERVRERGREMAQAGYEQASRKAAEVADVAEEVLQQHRGTEERHMWQGSGDNQGARQQPDAGTSMP